MIIAGIKAGATAAVPAMNYRTTDELRSAIREIKKEAGGPFGINLIVNKSNFTYKEQLAVICEEKVDFIITSHGSPEETIKQAHKNGIKVFCDVTILKYATKVESLGADALIALYKEAGGHAGKVSTKALVPTLKKHCKIPVISSRSVGYCYEMNSIKDLGADGY